MKRIKIQKKITDIEWYNTTYHMTKEEQEQRMRNELALMLTKAIGEEIEVIRIDDAMGSTFRMDVNIISSNSLEVILLYLRKLNVHATDSQKEIIDFVILKLTS